MSSNASRHQYAQLLMQLLDAAGVKYRNARIFSEQYPDSTLNILKTYDETRAFARHGGKPPSYERMDRLLVLVDINVRMEIRKKLDQLVNPDPHVDIGARLTRHASVVSRFIAARSQSDNHEHYGPVIPIWVGYNTDTATDRRFGIPARSVTIERDGFDYNYPPEAEADITPTGKNLQKYCLIDVEPSDLRDSLGSSVDLLVAPTWNHSIFRCDPFFHSENKKAVDQIKVKHPKQQIDMEEQLCRRLRYGGFHPRENRIPYNLTLMYTMVLNDEYVLLMRRPKAPEVSYYPSTVDLSGGEQLDVKDFTDIKRCPEAFSNWAKRAIIEEFLPTHGISDQKVLEDIRAEVFERRSTIHLQAIGFNVLDGSMPIFGLVRLPMTLDAYLKICSDIKKSTGGRARYDNEGRRGAVRLSALFKGMREGTVTYGSVTTGEVHKFAISDSDLHPMTPFRMHMLQLAYL